MRCVNPSIATVSPSRTRSAIASRIDATFELVIVAIAAASARRLDLVQGTRMAHVGQHLGASAGDGCDGLAEDAQRGRHLGLAHDQGRRHPDARPAALEDEQSALEAAHWTSSACSARVELDADHQALAAHVADEPVGSGPASGRSPASACSPRAAALSTRPPSSSSIVARAAAQATGLPPYVEPCAPGPHDSSSSARATIAPSGIPDAMPLAASRMSGSTPQCSTAHILPVRPAPGLDLVGDEQDPVRVADPPQALEEAVLGHDVAALALDRLDDDRRDLVGRRELVEEDLVEPAQVLDAAERGVEDAGQQRAEPGVVLGLRRGQRDRAVGPAVERAEERDHVRPFVA